MLPFFIGENMSDRNNLIVQAIQAAGGAVTNTGDRNALLLDLIAAVSGGSPAPGTGDVIYAGDVTASVDPMADDWGSPSQTTAVVMGTVTDEFVDAPTNIDAGEYRGVITKSFGPNFVDLMYTTLQGRMYKKLKFIDGGTPYNGGWEELGVSAKEAIWVLKNNALATTVTANTPIKFSADGSKFNAVEQDFLGDLNADSSNLMQFTVGQPGAFEVQIHGVIEDSANATQKIAVSIFDSATSNYMTGSMQILSPATFWGGTNEYTFNCTGFARLDPNNTASLEVVADANATIVLKECIVILKPIEY